MKAKHNFYSDKGFTLIELIVVVGIMVFLTTAFLVNFGALRGPRNLKIAAAELTTNLRKIQSYTLSSRDATTGIPAQYYFVTINRLAGSNTSYTVTTIDKNNGTATLETNKLPAEVVFNNITVYYPDGTTSYTNIECAQIAFKLPFAVTYVEYDATVNGTCSVNFIALQSNPVTLASLLNRRVTIELKELRNSGLSTVSVNGISGVIKQP